MMSRPSEVGQRGGNAPRVAEFSPEHQTRLEQTARRREVAAVQTQAEALLSLATSHGFPLFTGFGTYWHGWALAMQSQGEKGLPQIHQGMTTIVVTGQTLTQPLCLTTLAEAAGHGGPVDTGQRLLAKALSAFESTGRGDMVAEAYRLQGEFLLRQAVPDAVQAEASFQQALAIARRQQAKSWELRAAVSLSQLWQQQGKQDEVQELIASLYSWFTEGFDTADLQEAKGVLGDETIPKLFADGADVRRQVDRGHDSVVCGMASRITSHIPSDLVVHR